MKIGDFLKKQLQKAGIDITAEALQPVFAIDTDLPDENATAADRALLTVQAALSNSEVNKTMRQRILAGADTEIDNYITGNNIIPGGDFANEKNTFKKIGMLAKLAQDAGKKAAGATNKEGAKEWGEKEIEYNRQLKELKAAQTVKENELAAVKKQSKIDRLKDRIVLESLKDLNLNEDLDSDLRHSIALQALDKKASKLGAIWGLDENDNLILVDKDGNIAHDPKDNVPYEAKTVRDAAYAENKLLKINGTGDANQRQQQFANGYIPTNPLDAKRQQAAQAAIDYYAQPA